MSFLNLRSNSKPRVLHILDLSDDLLKNILLNCNLVDMTRCSLVSHRFREIIEDMEEEKAESLRSLQKGRIFICDRRRAILEGMSSHTPTRLVRESEKVNVTRNSSKETLLSPRDRRTSSNRTKSTGTSSDSSGNGAQNLTVSPFISDQYADNKQSNWAFKFDFEQWLDNYEIAEVFFKNFCSFFEREKSDMEMNYKGRTPSPPEDSRMYDKLPSTQANVVDGMHTKLMPRDIEGLKRISSGRVERLASTLKNVRNGHFVFKDYCCYTSRPPAIMFWFLSMMRRNVTRLTFDRVQSSIPVEAHEVLQLSNIHRLTVIQPEAKPGMIVRAELLMGWLNLPDALRRKISVHLAGCRELTPKGLSAFVEKWRNKPDPAIFKQISIDGNSYKFNDFINELELLQKEYEKVPPKSPFSKPSSDENAHAIVLEKTVEIHHSKDSTMVLRFKYCKPSRRMVLTCEVDDLQPLKVLSPVPTFSRLSLSRPHSAAALTELRSTPTMRPILTPDINKRISRPMSHNTLQIAGCRENNNDDASLVNRFLRFLATSN